MKLLITTFALLLGACGQEASDNSAPPPQPLPETASAGQSTLSSKAPLVLPLPKDHTELDRLILAGYTPHGSHLHPPGVKNCPLAKEGNEAVM